MTHFGRYLAVSLALCACGLAPAIAVAEEASPPATAANPSSERAPEPTTEEIAKRSADMIHSLASPAAGENAEAQYVLVGMAVQGHAPSQYVLGVMYREGTGMFPEPALAIKWLSLAAAQGHSEARTYLARMAEQGDAAAHRTLGRLYHDGVGIQRDQTAAKAHFRSAAELGDIEALLALALIGQSGDRTGLADPRVTRLLRDTTTEAMAATQRTFEGATTDASAPSEPWMSVAIDRTRAEIGTADAVHLELLARYWIGLMHLRGAGVPVNLAEALAHHCYAAVRGLDLAQHSLGLMYSRGQGVPRNIGHARGWFAQAAAQGHAPASMRLDQLDAVSQGADTEQDRCDLPGSAG